MKTLTFSLSPPPLATSCLRTKPGSSLLILHRKIFLTDKKSLLLKISDDVILHVICALDPPIKNSGYARIQEIFVFGYFPFEPIKKQYCSRAEDKTFLRTCRVLGQGLELRGQGLQNMFSRMSSRPRISSRTPPLVCSFSA